MHRITLSLATGVLILCGLVLQGCGSQPAPPASPPASTAAPATTPGPAATDQITSKKTGKIFSMVPLDESDVELEKFEPPAGGLGAASPDNFHGTARKAAKISISSGPTRTFADLAALFN